MGSKPQIEVVPLSSLEPQRENVNQHTPHGLAALERSMARDGLIDGGTLAADGSMISGSARLETAAGMGLEQAIIVDSDGRAPVYIRRVDIATNTTPQARRLSVLANAVPVQDWAPDVALLLDWATADALLLQEVERDADLAALLAGVPTGDEWDSALDGLPTGDKAPFQQMTFTLSNDQAALVKAAIERAKDAGPFVGAGNENSNGNALARICETYEC